MKLLPTFRDIFTYFIMQPRLLAGRNRVVICRVGGGGMRILIPIVGAPILIAVIGMALRQYRNLPQSALTDMLALFIGLDFTIAFDPTNFTSFLLDKSSVDSLFSIVMVTLFVSAVAWTFCVLEVEKRLATVHRYSQRFPFKLMMGVWVVNSSLFISHLALLSGRII
jgi:hypothetical protein